jgi:uncharacterized protein (TIGR02611 family)
VNDKITFTYQWAKRIAISIVGGSVLLMGLAMLVLPGPGLLVIPLGLAILGLEFAWARRWLRKVRESAQTVMSRRAAEPAQRASGTTAERNSSYERMP